MRKHVFFGMVAFLFIAGFPFFIHAASLSNVRPLGGRIVAGPASLSATIACSATYGPFMLQPFNVALPGPYFIQVTTKGTPRVSGYFLGLYKGSPDTGTCYNPETGVPVPAYKIDIYGVSK